MLRALQQPFNAESRVHRRISHLRFAKRRSRRHARCAALRIRQDQRISALTPEFIHDGLTEISRILIFELSNGAD
jgi:hypothetical protein